MEKINRELIKDDLYRAVNGEWLKTAIIPEDKPVTGGFQNLVMDIEKLLMNEFDNLKNTDNEEMNNFLKYYRMLKDNKKREEDGVQETLNYVNIIKDIKNIKEYNDKIAELILNGYSTPFDFGLSSDMKNAVKYALYLDVPSTILPDKTYYNNNKSGELLMDKYKEMIRTLFPHYGFSKEYIEELLEDTIAFDNLIHPNVKSSEELADYTKSYNPRTPEEVSKYSDYIELRKLANDITKKEVNKIIVTQPQFFEKYNEIVNDNNFKILKSWLIVGELLSAAKYLTNEMREIAGMYKRALSGIDKEMSLEKNAYYGATSLFSQVIGVYYGKKYFGEKAKKDVETMTRSMIGVYRKRLLENTWLNEETRKYAIKKLDSLNVLVGYPDTYKDFYKKLIINENETLFQNNRRMTVILIEEHFSKYDQDVDKNEWGMSSNTVNAYYHPTNNHICFPAAILQAPFYSLEQTESENYGGIGAVIGHEISHAFDNNGSLFDAEGNINNWWTDEDYKKFDNLAKGMIELFDGIPYASGKVNGKLTVSENIADAGGLSCALEALKNTGEYNLEEFFFNWARVWQKKAKIEYEDLLLNTDVHAPGELRANVQPKNLQEFYDTFDIKEEDKMYLDKNKRINIW